MTVLNMQHQGTVFMTRKVSDPSQLVAIKVLVKEKLYENISCIRKEVEILQKSGHPSISKYY